jgi:hypothetical protein
MISSDFVSESEDISNSEKMEHKTPVNNSEENRDDTSSDDDVKNQFPRFHFSKLSQSKTAAKSNSNALNQQLPLHLFNAVALSNTVGFPWLNQQYRSNFMSPLFANQTPLTHHQDPFRPLLAQFDFFPGGLPAFCK